MKKKKGVTTDRCAYWFIAPYYIFFLLFVLFPIVVNVGLSFTDFNLKTISFTGIKNYIALFHDGLFWKSVQNTFIYVVFTVFIGLSFFLMIPIQYPMRRMPHPEELLLF